MLRDSPCAKTQPLAAWLVALHMPSAAASEVVDAADCTTWEVCLSDLVFDTLLAPTPCVP